MVRLERRPGQKEERWAQLLGGESEGEAASPESPGAAAPQDDDRVGTLEARLERLERAFDELLARVDKVPGGE